MNFKSGGVSSNYMNAYTSTDQGEVNSPGFDLEPGIYISDISLAELEDLRITEYQLPLDTLEPELCGYL